MGCELEFGDEEPESGETASASRHSVLTGANDDGVGDGSLLVEDETVACWAWKFGRGRCIGAGVG